MADEIVDEPKQGGKGKGMIIIILVVLLMSAAGIAGGLYAAGALGSDEEEAEAPPPQDPNRPLLVKKGEDPVAIAEKAVADAGGGASEGGGEGGKKDAAIPHVETSFKIPKGGIELPQPKKAGDYQPTYFQMPAPYTSNLADTDSLVQIAMAVSTYYDARVTDALKTHELALRSAILMLLSQESAVELSTPQGKMALQHRLTGLINKILREKTGYSGVDNVYFTNFIIQ